MRRDKSKAPRIFFVSALEVVEVHSILYLRAETLYSSNLKCVTVNYLLTGKYFRDIGNKIAKKHQKFATSSLTVSNYPLLVS